MRAADLLLPATPELLDGWCGPVLYDLETSCTLCHDAFVVGDGINVPWPMVVDDGLLALDLSRAECRDRVARVLSKRSGSSPVWRWRTSHGHGFWEAGKRWFSSYDGIPALCIPALADLDPHDDTRLPDGSRLVDALALHAVAQEVLHGDR